MRVILLLAAAAAAVGCAAASCREAAGAEDGPHVDVESDPAGYYAPTFYRERGLGRNAGGFDAEAEAWVKPFREYTAGLHRRPVPGRRTVYLVPLGPQDDRTRRRIARIRDFLAVYLTLPVILLPDQDLDGCTSRAATVAGRTVRQYEAGEILRARLRPRLTGDALAVVGLATQDLYSETVDWDSVAHFSEAGKGLAVCGLARTFPEFFRREAAADGAYRDLRLAFGMAADVTCRAVGLTPCRKYYCVMNQARRSSTTEPLHLCPDCLRKLRWTLGFDLIERYERLETFYRDAGLPVEATWVQRRLNECRKARGEAREAAADESRAPGGETPGR
jgi:archaemetzincin